MSPITRILQLPLRRQRGGIRQLPEDISQGADCRGERNGRRHDGLGCLERL